MFRYYDFDKREYNTECTFYEFDNYDNYSIYFDTLHETLILVDRSGKVVTQKAIDIWELFDK